MLAIKLAVMTIGILIAFGLLGEFSKGELTTLRALVRRDPSTP
jgi:hypothetical protein